MFEMFPHNFTFNNLSFAIKISNSFQSTASSYQLQTVFMYPMSFFISLVIGKTSLFFLQTRRITEGINTVSVRYRLTMEKKLSSLKKENSHIVGFLLFVQFMDDQEETLFYTTSSLQ